MTMRRKGGRVSLHEATRLLGVTRHDITDLVKTHGLKAISKGGTWYLDLAALKAAHDRQQQQSARQPLDEVRFYQDALYDQLRRTIALLEKQNQELRDENRQQSRDIRTLTSKIAAGPNLPPAPSSSPATKAPSATTNQQRQGAQAHPDHQESLVTSNLEHHPAKPAKPTLFERLFGL